MRRALLALMTLGLAGCGSAGQSVEYRSTVTVAVYPPPATPVVYFYPSPPGTPLATPTAPTYISQQAAIDAALTVARSPQPELQGLTGTPTQIRAELLVPQDVEPRLREIHRDLQLSVAPAPGFKVWLVAIDGVWDSGAPVPAGLATPLPFLHYVVLLDARTGEGLNTFAYR